MVVEGICRRLDGLGTGQPKKSASIGLLASLHRSPQLDVGEYDGLDGYVEVCLLGLQY